MFEDGDFDGIEFSDYDLIQNAELEMDDVDRNWRFLAFLKNIKRRELLLSRRLVATLVLDLSQYVAFLTFA